MIGNMVNEQKMYVLIQARVRQGWAQADLAEHMGVATKTVARWESGSSIPQPGLRAKLGALLQIDPEELWPLNASLSVLPGPTDQVGVPYSQEPQRPLALPIVWNVPYLRNPFFTGREDLLAQLHARFQAGQALALSQPQAMSGLGGIGKTQIAVEYAYRFGQEYQAVLWAHAESSETLVSSYVALAVLLNLPEQDTQEQAIMVSAVKRWLQTHREWLLILDNADDLALVPEFLPLVLGGHLLLTTRAQAMKGLANRFEVETFSAEQGTLFLLRRAALLVADAPLEQAAVEDRERAGQIAKALGGLPLALDQAGAYLEETGCSLLEYQQLYQHHRAALLGERRGLVNDHPPVATTWSLSFQQIEKRNPAAADLLRMLAYLAPDAIPEEILTAGASLLGPVLAPVAANAFLLNQAIESLLAYSLIRRDSKGKALSVHRLVQAVIQDELEDAERSTWAERAMLAVDAAFPHAEYATWQQCERLLPQAMIATQLIERYQIVGAEVGRLLYETATYLLVRERYSEAEPFYQGLGIREQQLGPEHPEVATSLNALANLYRKQGKDAEAEALFQRALRIREQQLGPEHPEVATSLYGLANLYRVQSKYEQAELLFQRALRIREQQLGPEHPEMASPLRGLAALYEMQGKDAEAEALFQRALRIREQQLGPEHLYVAYQLYELADSYRVQGKDEQAEPLYQRALRIWEQQLGAEHHYVAYPLYRLANLYRVRGKDEQAEPLFQRALRIWELRLASDPNDAHVYLERGYVYLHLKKPDAARADFARHASLKPGNVNAAWMVVYTALSRQRPGGEVAERLEMIAALDPHCYHAYTCQGVALGLRGNLQEGLTTLEQELHLINAHSEDAWFWKGMLCAYLGHSTVAMESIEQALQIGLPSLLLTPLFWLEQENSRFYQEYAEPLLKGHELL
jgi:tetratricopeptide (TPR) repeat protein/transcriptional regulator with XRE-family HTH domain